MKTKNIIKHLNKFNKWRQWADIKMPEPKEITETINEAIDRLQQHEQMINSMKQTNQALSKQIQNNDEHFKNAIWEMKFNSLQKQHYLSLLEEVEVLLDKNINPNLIKEVIKNWKERAILDESIHYDELNRDFT